MTTTDLSSTLTAHAAWLADPSTGTRADLSEANLNGADLSGANLTNVTWPFWISGNADLTGAK